jgi:hypothetical protein
VADLHAAFRTHSDRELFAECVRRGITGPTGASAARDLQAG